MVRHRLVLLALVIALIFTEASAAGEEYREGWIMCQPDSYVNIREAPKTSANESGYLVAGDRIFLDGKVKNGYAHCVRLSTEASEGWVYKGFISSYEPVKDGREYRIRSKGRVAARRSISGDRRCWLHNDDILTVHLRSDDWCLTNKGFVKSEFIDFDSEEE